MTPFLQADNITVKSITAIPVFSLLISIHFFHLQINSNNNKINK